MSQPTESERRRAIDETAKDWHATVRRSGNTDYTIDDARRRVAGAVNRGDRIRDNRNR